MIYGLLAEFDPRDYSLSKSSWDNMYAVFHIVNVVNPNQGYDNTALSFSAMHNRYTYEGGPKMIVHQSTGIVFDHDIIPGKTYAESCELSNAYRYEHLIRDKNVAKDVEMFVDFKFRLDHPAQANGYIYVKLEGMSQPSQVGSYTYPCYVTHGLTAYSGSRATCEWRTGYTDQIKISNYATS